MEPYSILVGYGLFALACVAGFAAAWKAQGFRVDLVKRDVVEQRDLRRVAEQELTDAKGQHARDRAAADSRFRSLRRQLEAGRLGLGDLDDAVGLLFSTDEDTGHETTPPARGADRPELTGAGDPEPLGEIDTEGAGDAPRHGHEGTDRGPA